MATSQIVVPGMKPLVVPSIQSGGYSRGESKIEYSPALARDSEGKVIVGTTRNQAREIAKAAGYRLSTATHEYELSKKGYKDEAFNDTFSRNKQKTYFWNWTDTGLLKPKGKKSECTKETKGRKYWLRIITEGGKEVGELWVPQGGGRIVREWSVFGLPTETVDEKEHKDGTETHFYFEPSLEEISVLRYGRWSDHEGCFSLGACCGPAYSYSCGSFRPVRGSVSKYSKLTA